MVIHSTPDLTGNSGGCATPGCKCCKSMSRKVIIRSTHNNKSFRTPTHTNCHTTNAIYLLECTRCSKKKNQYVGQTQRTMTKRLAGHRAASRIKTYLPIYKHFANSPYHCFNNDIKVTILEKTVYAQSMRKHLKNQLSTCRGNNTCTILLVLTCSQADRGGQQDN